MAATSPMLALTPTVMTLETITSAAFMTGTPVSYHHVRNIIATAAAMTAVDIQPLAAAPKATLADGITRLLALAEELHVGHNRLVRVVGPPVRNVRVVIGNADHQARRSCGPIDGRARRSRRAIEQVLQVRHGHLPRPRRQARFPPRLPSGSLAPSIY